MSYSIIINMTLCLDKKNIKKTQHKVKQRDLLSVYMNAKLQKKPKTGNPITESPWTTHRRHK